MKCALRLQYDNQKHRPEIARRSYEFRIISYEWRVRHKAATPFCAAHACPDL